MEIFSLVGKVVVDYSDACEQLERISEAAEIFNAAPGEESTSTTPDNGDMTATVQEAAQ